MSDVGVLDGMAPGDDAALIDVAVQLGILSRTMGQTQTAGGLGESAPNVHRFLAHLAVDWLGRVGEEGKGPEIPIGSVNASIGEGEAAGSPRAVSLLRAWAMDNQAAARPEQIPTLERFERASLFTFSKIAELDPSEIEAACKSDPASMSAAVALSRTLADRGHTLALKDGRSFERVLSEADGTTRVLSGDQMAQIATAGLGLIETQSHFNIAIDGNSRFGEAFEDMVAAYKRADYVLPGDNEFRDTPIAQQPHPRDPDTLSDVTRSVWSVAAAADKTAVDSIMSSGRGDYRASLARNQLIQSLGSLQKTLAETGLGGAPVIPEFIVPAVARERDDSLPVTAGPFDREQIDAVARLFEATSRLTGRTFEWEADSRFSTIGHRDLGAFRRTIDRIGATHAPALAANCRSAGILDSRLSAFGVNQDTVGVISDLYGAAQALGDRALPEAVARSRIVSRTQEMGGAALSDRDVDAVYEGRGDDDGAFETSDADNADLEQIEERDDIERTDRAVNGKLGEDPLLERQADKFLLAHDKTFQQTLVVPTSALDRIAQLQLQMSHNGMVSEIFRLAGRKAPSTASLARYNDRDELTGALEETFMRADDRFLGELPLAGRNLTNAEWVRFQSMEAERARQSHNGSSRDRAKDMVLKNRVVIVNDENFPFLKGFSPANAPYDYIRDADRLKARTLLDAARNGPDWPLMSKKLARMGDKCLVGNPVVTEVLRGEIDRCAHHEKAREKAAPAIKGKKLAFSFEVGALNRLLAAAETKQNADPNITVFYNSGRIVAANPDVREQIVATPTAIDAGSLEDLQSYALAYDAKAAMKVPLRKMSRADLSRALKDQNPEKHFEMVLQGLSVQSNAIVEASETHFARSLFESRNPVQSSSPEERADTAKRLRATGTGPTL